ncbi:hypothetical protein [Bacillus velezensis]|uniref:hypothetical protein n=1 Tax=Bacillus velezensis TaxID=492670 RepID=UPI003783578A
MNESEISLPNPVTKLHTAVLFWNTYLMTISKITTQNNSVNRCEALPPKECGLDWIKNQLKKSALLCKKTKNLEVMQEKLIDMNRLQKEELEKYKKAYQELRRDYQDVQEESNSRLNQVGNAHRQNDQLVQKVRSLQAESSEYKNQVDFLVANYNRLKSNEKLLEEYKQGRR